MKYLYNTTRFVYNNTNICVYSLIKVIIQQGLFIIYVERVGFEPLFNLARIIC